MTALTVSSFMRTIFFNYLKGKNNKYILYLPYFCNVWLLKP